MNKEDSIRRLKSAMCFVFIRSLDARLIGITMSATAMWLLAGLVADAHPANGIAIDRNGNVYFADVAKTTIWKLDADGKLTAYVENSWTHGIQLETDGTLYYERELEVSGVAPCELNRITPSGKREKVIPPAKNRADFSGAPFVRLGDGSVLFAHSIRDDEGRGRAAIRRRGPDGKITTLAGAKQGPLYVDGAAHQATFRMITDMKLGPDGQIYLLDRDRLRRMSLEGRTDTLARDLLDKAPLDPPQKTGPPTTINRLYGLAFGAENNVFIAYHAGRRVIRVTPSGEVSSVLSAKRPWAPVGVAVGGGNLYVLEVHDDLRAAGPRVRRLSSNGHLSTLVTVDKMVP